VTDVVAERRSEPRISRPLIPSGVLGMLLFIFTEVMLFAGMISAHAIVKGGATEWPPGSQPVLPFAETMFNTAALLASGVFLLFAHLRFRKSPRSALVPLSLALGLGAFFVVFQGREWLALLAEGLTLTSSTYGAFFYLIVGTHALHALGAILALGWAVARLRQGRLLPTQLWTVEAFWYFVVLVWPVLYFRVYL
jgi:cytochrome c oxidase subunit 3